MPRNIILVRHAERVDYVAKEAGNNWQASEGRRQPWNSPITARGKQQALALGQAIRRHCEAADIPLPSLVRCSPMLRCVQTVRAALDGMSHPIAIQLEPGLSETMCENWYRSWATPGADSTWGGHPGMTQGIEVADADLHPMAVAPSSECLRASVAELALHAELTIDASFAPAVAIDELAGYRFGKYEAEGGREQGLCARLAVVLERERAAQDDETTLLVSHGGPSAAFFQIAMDGAPPRPGFTGNGEDGSKWRAGWPVCPYTGLYLLRPAAGGALKAVLAADTSHLKELGPAPDGVVMAEQCVSRA